jgi:hypothetical protein
MIRKVFRTLASRKTATVLRWKTVGPHLGEIDRGARFLERKAGFLSMGRGVARLHDQLRGRSFSRFGKAGALRRLGQIGHAFRGNQYVKLGRPSLRLARKGLRGGLARFGRKLL